VEIRNGEAETGRGLESSTRGVHLNCWGRKGVIGRKHQGAPVLAIVVGCVGRAGEDVVPSV